MFFQLFIISSPIVQLQGFSFFFFFFLLIFSSFLNKQNSRYNRVIFKFTENHFEKIERLVELHHKYLFKV